MTKTTTKLTASAARQMIGCTVSHRGQDLRIEDVRHMGVAGWVMRLSNGALLKPSEIR